MNFINVALEEAIKAEKEGNVPIGAVIVCNNKIISQAHNTKNTSNISVNHAEILCIEKACMIKETWHLEDCEIYVTLKPCDMCLAAIAESRIKKVYYLLDSNYYENISKNIKDIKLIKLESKNNNYLKILSDFFKKLR